MAVGLCRVCGDVMTTQDGGLYCRRCGSEHARLGSVILTPEESAEFERERAWADHVDSMRSEEDAEIERERAWDAYTSAAAPAHEKEGVDGN